VRANKRRSNPDIGTIRNRFRFILNMDSPHTKFVLMDQKIDFYQEELHEGTKRLGIPNFCYLENDEMKGKRPKIKLRIFS